MAERSKNAQRVFDAIEPLILPLGMDLIDVAFVREGKSMFLRVFIDKDGGVAIDDCTAVTRIIDPVIDQTLKIDSHDYLEVSSPGLDRPLKTDRDFNRYQDQWVELSLYQPWQGKKKWSGKLAPCRPDTVVIRLEDDSVLSFTREQVAKVSRMVRFS